MLAVSTAFGLVEYTDAMMPIVLLALPSERAVLSPWRRSQCGDGRKGADVA